MESDRALTERPGLDPCRIVWDDEGSDVPSLRIDTTRLLAIRRLDDGVAEEDESRRNGRRHDYGKSHGLTFQEQNARRKYAPFAAVGVPLVPTYSLEAAERVHVE